LSADFNHPLSYERPFKFPRHLVGFLEIDSIVAMSAINIHSAIFKQHGNRNGHGNGNGHKNGN
jgi:branched-subunit amino acid transport protein